MKPAVLALLKGAAGERVLASRMRCDYVEYNGAGAKEAVYCRCCGDKIAGFVDSEVVDHVKVPGTDTVKVVVRQRFAKLHNYTQLHFRLSDGSIIEPAFCATCAGAVTPDDYDDIMSCEMYAWVEELVMAGRSEESARRLLSRMANLRIVGTMDTGR